jgi:hypothetical protein
MSRPYYFGSARRSLRAKANADGVAASNAALAAVKAKDLDGARALFEAAADHFKAAGVYDRQVQCIRAIGYLEGYAARMAS